MPQALTSENKPFPILAIGSDCDTLVYMETKEQVEALKKALEIAVRALEYQTVVFDRWTSREEPQPPIGYRKELREIYSLILDSL